MDAARLSLRAQLALASLVASMALVAAGLAATVPLLYRLGHDQAAADAALVGARLGRLVQARCGASAACVERELESLRAAGFRVERRSDGRLAVEADEGGAQAARFAALAAGLGAVGGGAIFLLLYGALLRAVARPTDRLIAATERVGQLELPLLGEQGPVLGRLGGAFDRMAQRLAEERARVQAQLEELRRINAELARTRALALRHEKLATVGRLSSGVAHEIGNPLAAILGHLELIRARPEGGALAEHVERMEREARRIDRIVRELLDFARPSRAELGPIDVGAAIEGAARLLASQPGFRGIELRVSLARDLPRARGDEHRLRQILVNLATNARDAMEGQGLVELSARAEADRLVVSVRDRGPGIPAPELERIFDPFFTTKAPGEGTGLGLAICHALAESLGGSISAANDPAGGARFELVLPVDHGRAGAPAAVS